MSRIVCWNARSAHDKSWHFSIRHRVFVEEQQIIPLTDIDEWDRGQGTVHVVACRDSGAAGTVRLYRTDDDGGWKGDRLAVLPQHRATTVGARLVHHAVSTAASLGGRSMDALVQVQNVRFFERIGWKRCGQELSYFGLPHQPMVFDLSTAAALDVRQVPPDAYLELPANRYDPSPLLAATELAAEGIGIKH